MMKFLKFFFAIIALGCVVELSAYLMGRTGALLLVGGLSILILFICAIVYFRASGQRDLATQKFEKRLELSISPLNAPIMLKTPATSTSGGSSSSVAPMNRVNSTPDVAPKSTMKSSMR